MRSPMRLLVVEPRPLAPACLIGCLIACLCAMGALQAASADPLLADYLKPNQTPDALTKARYKLLAEDPKTLVQNVAAVYCSSDNAVDLSARLQLIALLGQVHSVDSIVVLNSICSMSNLNVAEIRDWPGLARAIQKGGQSGAGAAVGRIWLGLNPDQRQAVDRLAAPQAPQAPPDPKAPQQTDASKAAQAARQAAMDREALMEGLHQIVCNNRFCTDAMLAEITLPKETQPLVESWRRWVKDGSANAMPGEEFTSNMACQLNLAVIRTVYHDELRANLSIPPRLYEPHLMDAALKALQGMADMPLAADAIINLWPDIYQARGHIKALAGLQGQAATARLFRYVWCPAVSASNLARDVLKDRIKNDNSFGLAEMVQDIVGFFASGKAQGRSLAPFINRNIMELALALPNEDNLRLVMETALTGVDKPLQDAGFDALAHKPTLVSDDVIRQAVAKRMTDDTSAQSELAMLDILQRSGDKPSLKFAAAQLTHPAEEVRVKAGRVMEVLTGKNLGVNPSVWLQWWNAQAQSEGQ